MFDLFQCGSCCDPYAIIFFAWLDDLWSFKSYLGVGCWLWENFCRFFDLLDRFWLVLELVKFCS
jgi:hypothetical protein